MRVLGVLLVAAACGAKAPAESLDNLQQRPPETTAKPYRKGIAAPRPAIDISWAIPDFHDELRWPLHGMNHPALEPHFPVARKLAVGVDWQQLCARGVHKRVSATQKELLSYLHGWCDVAKHDVDAACTHLVPLLGSVISGIRPAVRQDLANILVEQGDADKAEHWLSKHKVRDIATLDLLAANYVEVGSLADAFKINQRAADSDDYASATTKCMRLVKRIVIGHDHDTVAAEQELKGLVFNMKVKDDTCNRLWNKVGCWRDQSNCYGYFADENVELHERSLVDAYRAWPSYAANWAEWWNYAQQAVLSLPAPGAAELVVSALELSLRAKGSCDEGMASGFQHLVGIVWRSPEGPSYQVRLQQIENACPKPALPKDSPASAPPAVDSRPAVKPRPVAEWPTSPSAP